MFMLDTDICIYIMKERFSQLLDRLEDVAVSKTCMSAITHAELMNGVCKSERKEKNLIVLKTLIKSVQVIPFDEQAGEVYGRVRSDLEKRGEIIGNHDLLIASHALSQKMTLVTHNTREFKRVKGLKMEDWTI